MISCFFKTGAYGFFSGLYGAGLGLQMVLLA